MGCNNYPIHQYAGGVWLDAQLMLATDMEGFPDVCTFGDDSPIDAGTVRTLAAIGAALVLAHNGHLPPRRVLMTPTDIPERLLGAIQYFVPEQSGTVDGVRYTEDDAHDESRDVVANRIARQADDEARREKLDRGI